MLKRGGTTWDFRGYRISPKDKGGSIFYILTLDIGKPCKVLELKVCLQISVKAGLPQFKIKFELNGPKQSL